MKVTHLSRQEADQLMKSLDMDGDYYRNFYGAFHDERMRVHDRGQFWALSEEERSYFLVESYLFGVNFQNPNLISISSFARILRATPSQKCAPCFKFLLQETLFPMCVVQRKYCISAVLTEKGKTVFRELQKVLPGIQIEKFDGYYYPATITCKKG